VKRLVWGASFRRAFKRVAGRTPHLQERIFVVLETLAVDPFTPSLKTHKLRGQLEGL